MRLERDPSLAEAPGFTTEQLDSLSRSIEAKQQKLEADINAYIKKKQRELALYEHEVPYPSSPPHPHSVVESANPFSSWPITVTWNAPRLDTHPLLLPLLLPRLPPPPLLLFPKLTALKTARSAQSTRVYTSVRRSSLDS